MNLNKKITKFTADGIPAYNNKINELIEAVNWLAGMRTINGRAVSESDQGPVIDLSQAGSTQPSGTNNPWKNDPDGNPAGWMKVLILNPDQTGSITQASWIQWIWTGPTELVGSLPWQVDPGGNRAKWIVCTNNTFWGTGSCTGAVGNFQAANTLWSGSQPPNSVQYPNYASPQTWTSNPQKPPITVPSTAPAFYIEMAPAPAAANLPNAPCLAFSVGVTSLDPPTTFTWQWTLQYQGTVVLSYSGSFTATYQAGVSATYVNLDPTGWVFDPAGLAGYAQGSKQWIWEYQGAIDPSTNPTVIQTFTYSLAIVGRTAGIVSGTVIFLTA